MRNVLFVTFEYLPFAGGIASYTYQIAKGFFDQGCRVTVLAPHYPGCEDLDRKTPFRTVRMNLDHAKPETHRVVPGLRALYGTLLEVQPDAVMLTSDLAHALGALMCSWLQFPFAAVVHGSEITKHFPPGTVKRALQRPWLQYCYQHASAVFCVSEYVRGLMTDAGFSRQHLHVVYNGIDEGLLRLPEDSEKVARVRERHGLQDKKVMLTVARLVKRKGHDLMIRAMPEVLRRQESACYLIVGVGEEEERLKALAREVGVEQAVIFTGMVPEEEKLAYLDASDVFVLSSNNDGQRVEGLGIALLEAAARRKPLIGTACGGIREVVEDGFNGYLVGVTDVRLLAVRAAELLADGSRAQEMGVAAKTRVRERFTTLGMAEQTYRLLREAVEFTGR